MADVTISVDTSISGTSSLTHTSQDLTLGLDLEYFGLQYSDRRSDTGSFVSGFNRTAAVLLLSRGALTGDDVWNGLADVGGVIRDSF